MNKTFSIVVMSVLFVILGYLGYLIFKPFLIPIAWAAVLSILFYPLYAFILRYLRWTSAAALVVLVVIITIILGPVSYLSFLMIQEVRMITISTDSGFIAGLQDILHHPSLQRVLDRIMSLFNVTEDEFTRALSESVRHLGQAILGNIGKGIAGIVTGLLDFFFMTVSLFFFLRDGRNFAKKLLDVIPFSDAQKKAMVGTLKDIVIATMFGGVVVAFAQGLTGGLAFALLGISSPILWGFAMGITSFLPIVGPFIIWMPAAVYLLLTGAIGKGIALILIGVFGIGLIDNVLRPAIVGSRTRMHYLPLFFAVLGGIKLFGMIGIILGPLLFSLFLSLIEVFRHMDERGQPSHEH